MFKSNKCQVDPSRQINVIATYSPINRQSCFAQNNCVFTTLLCHVCVMCVSAPDTSPLAGSPY